VIKINNRKLLDGLFDANGVADVRQRLTALRAIDKFDRLGWPGVRDLLGAGRLDESGDYTKGAELSTAATAAIQSFLAIENAPDLGRIEVVHALGTLKMGAKGEAALTELELIAAALAGMGVPDDVARIDTTVVRGLEYYTGTVFEAELLLQTTDDKGQAVRFGSIGGGGRYDDLVARFTGQQVPATGFSFGVSRLASALRAAGRDVAGQARGPVVVIAFDQTRMSDYFEVAGELRAAGIAAEVYLGGSGMRPQMKYADRRLAPAAIIIGEDELAAGTATVKDLDLGRALSAGVTDNAAWREQRPGQVTVPRAELVATIRRILDAQP
jgi:histidyl-tRNA synthetase